MATSSNQSSFRVDTSDAVIRVDGVEGRTDQDGRPVLDAASGQQKFAVYLSVRHQGRTRPDQWTVTVAGAPKIAVDSIVTVTGLVAFPWEQNGRHGIALRAESIQPANQPAHASRPVEPVKAC